MLRTLTLAVATLLLSATLAFADPGVRVQTSGDVVRIELTGSYPQSFYTIYRSIGSLGPWQPVSSLNVLCLGPCFAEDPAARPGETYWYRFDLALPDGGFASFGPFEVTIPATVARTVGARMLPNPSRGAATIEWHLSEAGSGDVPARVQIYDLQGRRVRTVLDGRLTRGLGRVAWDGRDEAGRTLDAGAYFLEVRTPLGVSRTRFLRLR